MLHIDQFIYIISNNQNNRLIYRQFVFTIEFDNITNKEIV